MKKKILILAVMVVALTKISAQTTKTEYLYITKGLITSLQQGLDMKKGYTLNLISTTPKESENACDIYSLDRENGTTSAIVIMIKNYDEIKVLCLPHKKTEEALKEQCYNDFNELSNENLQLIIKMISEAGQEE